MQDAWRMRYLSIGGTPTGGSGGPTLGKPNVAYYPNFLLNHLMRSLN